MICKNCGYEYSGVICDKCGTQNNECENNVDNQEFNTIVDKKTELIQKIKSLVKKKWFWIIVAILVILIIVPKGFNKSEAAKNVIAEIKTLTDISEDSDSAIHRVEMLYDGLSDSDKKDVSNYNKLKKARNKCDELIANKVVSQINELDDNADIEEIEKIKDEYQELTENQKNYVTNYDDLEVFETNYYAKKVSNVESLIDKISYVSGKISDEESTTIDNAIKAYEELNGLYKNKVNNYSKLEKAISNRDAYLIEIVQEKIDASISSGKNYDETKAEYEKLSENAKGKITNYDAFESKFAEINLNKGLQSQELTIESTKYVVQHERYKALYPDLLQVIIKNNTKYDIKNAVVAYVAWDSNKLPVKIEASGVDTSGGSYVRYCNFDDINLVSGKTYGKESGFAVDENCNIKYFKAIIVSYETFEGETWENPLYDTWENLYAGQRLAG